MVDLQLEFKFKSMLNVSDLIYTAIKVDTGYLVSWETKYVHEEYYSEEEMIKYVNNGSFVLVK